MAAIVVWLQNNIQYHDLNNNKKTQTNISAGGYCHLAPIPAGLHSWRFPHQVLTFIEIFLHLFFTYILYLYFLTLNYPAEIVNQVVFVYSSWVCSEAINLFSVSRYDFNTTEDTDPSSQCYLGDSHKKTLDCFSHFIGWYIFLFNVWLTGWCRHSGQGLGHWISYLCAFQSIHRPRPGMLWFFDMIVILCRYSHLLKKIHRSWPTLIPWWLLRSGINRNLGR